ncbi:TetR/AcrR family transcriptional regulator [Lachnospiraceae bacterium MD308]|nr:TetR/AcrR family transcriptional regulator [Lachnospiraceae bacterium MD308]MCI8580651.1 TetR/AcrR family transcriptional regulator [Dorea sp.]
MKKNIEKDSLRQTIMDAAWDLFYKKGYENTTINDIIRQAGTSKGGFYYYFRAKDELLNSLYSFFDQEYEKFYKTMDKSLNSLIQLKQLGQYVSYFIEGNVSPEFLCALYKSQLSNQTQENFLSTDRYYIKLVKKIIAEGQKKGEIRDDIPVDKLAHHVLVIERGIFVDWCVQAGSFSLGYFGAQSFEFYSEFMKPHNKTQ